MVPKESARTTRAHARHREISIQRLITIADRDILALSRCRASQNWSNYSSMTGRVREYSISTNKFGRLNVSHHTG